MKKDVEPHYYEEVCKWMQRSPSCYKCLPLASVAEEAYKLCVVFDYVATLGLKT